MSTPRLEELKRRLKNIESNIKRTRKRLEELRDEQDNLYSTIHRLEQVEKLQGLIGKRVKLLPGVACRNEFRDAIGTLVKTNRTRGIVDFEVLGRFRVPLSWITAESTAGIDDGCTMSFGGES